MKLVFSYLDARYGIGEIMELIEVKVSPCGGTDFIWAEEINGEQTEVQLFVCADANNEISDLVLNTMVESAFRNFQMLKIDFLVKKTEEFALDRNELRILCGKLGFLPMEKFQSK